MRLRWSSASDGTLDDRSRGMCPGWISALQELKKNFPENFPRLNAPNHRVSTTRKLQTPAKESDLPPGTENVTRRRVIFFSAKLFSEKKFSEKNSERIFRKKFSGNNFPRKNFCPTRRSPTVVARTLLSRGAKEIVLPADLSTGSHRGSPVRTGGARPHWAEVPSGRRRRQRAGPAP